MSTETEREPIDSDDWPREMEELFEAVSNYWSVVHKITDQKYDMEIHLSGLGEHPTIIAAVFETEEAHR